MEATGVKAATVETARSCMLFRRHREGKHRNRGGTQQGFFHGTLLSTWRVVMRTFNVRWSLGFLHKGNDASSRHNAAHNHACKTAVATPTKASRLANLSSDIQSALFDQLGL
jgi:hypothetical protein